MARNKHPEETVNLILDVSFSLFMEKGYENTSIQDIIQHLGGLSKGAIYHHFKSKEDILNAVIERITAESDKKLAAIRDSAGLTGKEKLAKLFLESISSPVQDDIFTVAPDLSQNPRLISSQLYDTVKQVAPEYIQPIIEQGIRDGSIQTDYPGELAELVMLAANVWMNPMVFQDTTDKTHRKFMVFRQMMKGLGLDIADEEMLDRLRALTDTYQKNR